MRETSRYDLNRTKKLTPEYADALAECAAVLRLKSALLLQVGLGHEPDALLVAVVSEVQDVAAVLRMERNLLIM